MTHPQDLAQFIIDAAAAMNHVVGDGTTEMDVMSWVELAAHEARRQQGRVRAEHEELNRAAGWSQVDELANQLEDLLQVFGWVEHGMHHARPEWLDPVGTLLVTTTALDGVADRARALLDAGREAAAPTGATQDEARATTAIEDPKMAAMTALVYDAMQPAVACIQRVARAIEDDGTAATWVKGAIYGAVAQYMTHGDEDIEPEAVNAGAAAILDVMEAYYGEPSKDPDTVLRELVPQAFTDGVTA